MNIINKIKPKQEKAIIKRVYLANLVFIIFIFIFEYLDKSDKSYLIKRYFALASFVGILILK